MDASDDTASADEPSQAESAADDDAERDPPTDGDADSVDPWDTDGSADGWVAEAGSSDATAGATSTSDGTEAANGETANGEAAQRRDTAPSAQRRYRVLDVAGDALVFVDLDVPEPGPGPGPDEGFEPVRVAATGYDGDLATTVDEIDPGNVVRARLRWPDSDAIESAGGDTAEEPGTTGASPLAHLDSLTVERESRYFFADDVDPLFEAARDAWEDARAAGEGMGSRVTRDADAEPNGALYVFAEAGARDLLGEFRSGTTPLEPLVDRVNEDLPDDDPREVFVLRPARGEFVVVYIAFEKDGLLARTVRDTYL